MPPGIPSRVRPLLGDEPRLDPDLSWAELLALVVAFLEEELDAPTREQALRFLEANLPGARLGDLIEWPGEWFGNRWLEEVVLAPEELAYYALARSGRELDDAPRDPELPFPLP